MNVSHIKDLQHDPKNRRKHNPRNIGMLVDALQQVGAARSIVIDETGEILAGNGVIEAAAEAGLTRVQVVDADGQTVIAVRRTGLTDEQKRALAIYDNRVAELAEWDWERLAQDKADGLPLQPFWSQEEEQAMVANRFAHAGASEEDDDLPDVRETDIVRGDRFDLGRHLLICGDCEDSELIGMADAVVTDPPYGIDVVKGRTGAISGDKPFGSGYGRVGVSKITKAKIYKQVQGDGEAFDPTHLFALAPRQVIWGANYFPQLLASRGQWLVWDKNRPEGTTFSDCELAWVNRDDRVAVKKKTITWHGMIREGEHDARVHPTQKPVALMAWCIETATDGAASIIDPYAGSGSTLIACDRLNRRCVAVEIDPEYCQVIIDRWETFTGQKAVKVGEAVRA